jgi:Tol biopolymer transport system component
VPEPTVFAPGVVSSDLRDYDIAFGPLGFEAYFTRRSRRGPPQILVTRFEGGAWSDPSPVAFASGRDEAPFVSPDGETLYFSSRRPLSGEADPSDNLWRVRRTEHAWGSAEPVPGPVNRPHREIGRSAFGAELGPTLFPDGSLLYWTREDPDWGSDLYVARPDGDGGFLEPEPLRINSYGDEASPAVSPDGEWLVFQAYRDADAPGEQDLYASHRTVYGWSDPEPLPEPINSPFNEGYPSFSPDGRHFFFATDRDGRNGWYDIWWVDVEALGLPGLGRSPR